jgi:hypothetical protein
LKPPTTEEQGRPRRGVGRGLALDEAFAIWREHDRAGWSP